MKAYNYETEIYLGMMKWFWQGDIKRVTGYKLIIGELIIGDMEVL